MSLTWKQKRKLLKFFVPSIQQHPNWPVIICEGDSWFSFDLHANVIDHLDEMVGRKISLLRLERNGDGALRIIGGKQKAKLADYLERFPVQALLFSGGGNDVIGSDLLSLLNQKTDGMAWHDCINQETTKARLEAVRSAFVDLVHLRNENRPNCRIYLHGYDWAIPSGRGVKAYGIQIGPWMKPHLETKGITDPQDQRKIIHDLLKRFHAMQQALVAAHQDVVWVETPGTLSTSDWNDEIHPTRDGFEKIAKKFRKELKNQFPGTF